MKYKYHKDNVPNPKLSRYNPANAEWYEMRNKDFLEKEKVWTWRELQDNYGLSIRRIAELKKSTSRKFKGV